MRKYRNTYSLDTLMHRIDETYPSDFFGRAYDEVRPGSTCEASLEREVARCLVNVILQNYSDASSPERNLQRIAGEVDRFASLVREVQVRLAEISDTYGDADGVETLLGLLDEPIRS